MKRIIVVASLLAFVGTAAAQEADTTATGSNGADLLRELWFMDDARPIDVGQIDVRLTFGWETASAPANLGDSNDNFVLQPGITWGACDNVEIFANVPVWLGDGGDRPALDRGNADTTLGFTWRFMEPADVWPAVALHASMRLPTGDDSSGVDGEARLILTNEYDSGIRSHVNAFAQSVNGDNDPNLRHFQWGLVAGLDGPLCGGGVVRWVADYMHRSSFHEGASNMHMFEVGWEWDMNEAQKLGFALQVGLDRVGDTPNLGVAIAYAHSLTY